MNDRRREFSRLLATLAVLGLWAAMLPGCRRESAGPVFVLDARDHAPAPPAAVAAPPAPPSAPAAEADAEYSAVEISGEIELPPGRPPKERLMIYIASRDCLNDASPLLRRLPVSDNRTFFTAVMAPKGSALSVCAAAEPAPGKPSHLYGRALQPLQIQKSPDQAFGGIKITLTENPPRPFPTQISR